MLKGWVWFYTGELAEIFAVTFIFIFGTLIIYFRRLYGVLLPFIGAVAQAIWGLGFLGILGYNLDPLVLVIPLLVSARAASHGVQMVERYFEELEATGDKHHAVSIAMGELLLPAESACWPTPPVSWCSPSRPSRWSASWPSSRASGVFPTSSRSCS